MAIDQRLNQIHSMQDELRDMLETVHHKVGGGGNDGMDHRISRLEGQVDSLSDKLDRRSEQLSDRIGKVETGIATLSERVSHLPSKSYIDIRLLGMLAVIAALITFGDKIRHLVGV